MDLFIAILTYFEFNEEVLDFCEGLSEFYCHILIITIVSGKFELLSFILPALTTHEWAFKVLLVQGFLPLVIDNISRMNSQSSIEPIEFDPYLLLKHDGCLLRSREKYLIDLHFIPCGSFFDDVSLKLRTSVIDLYFVVLEDDFENFMIRVLLVEEEEFHIFDRELEFLGWVVEELLVVLFDEYYASGFVVEFKDLRLVDLSLSHVSLVNKRSLFVSCALETALNLRSCH